jgi:hypothetical protein
VIYHLGTVNFNFAQYCVSLRLKGDPDFDSQYKVARRIDGIVSNSTSNLVVVADLPFRAPGQEIFEIRHLFRKCHGHKRVFTGTALPRFKLY